MASQKIILWECVSMLLVNCIYVNHIDYNPEEFCLNLNATNEETTTTNISYKSNNPKIDFFSTTYGDFRIYGYKPKSDGNFPLYIHLTGTTNYFWDNTCRKVTEYMSSSDVNIVSVSIEYDTSTYPLGCSKLIPLSFGNKASSLWDISNPNSAISVLCNQIHFIDCNKGIAISGLSQGAQLASQSAKYGLGQAITAVHFMSGGDMPFISALPFLYYTCLSFNSLSLAQNKIRSIAHENDMIFGGDLEGVRRQQISITNHFECDHDHDLYDNDTNSHDCIDEIDGSGFYIIGNNAFPRDITRGHTYMFACNIGPYFCFEANDFNEIFSTTNAKWGLKSNMDWLINMIRNKKPQTPIQFTDTNSEPSLFYQIIDSVVSFFTGESNQKDEKECLCSESTNSFTNIGIIIIFCLILNICLLAICVTHLKSYRYHKVNYNSSFDA